jgi:hypothetical protein
MAELRVLREFQSARAAQPVSGPRGLDYVLQVLATRLSQAPEPAAALRGASESQTVSYAAGALTINLTQYVESSGVGTTIVGLVWYEDDSNANVDGFADLIDSGGEARLATIDRLGNFIFEGVPSGAYRLELRISPRVVRVGDLQVGS